MSNQVKCTDQDCAQLKREIDALELLVNRYQHELVNQRTCFSCRRIASQSFHPVEEELFEQQQLNGLHWTEPTAGNAVASAVPFLTRRNGERCSFEDVRLPSPEWEWTSDWRVDVDSHSDVNGWTYAISQLDSDGREDYKACVALRLVGKNELHNSLLRIYSERSIDERVRRRRWMRQRKYVGSKELPVAVAHTLEQERKLCEMQSANEKLTEQLRRANDRILDCEDRLKKYEVKLLELQRSPLRRPPPLQTQSMPASLLASTDSLFSPSKSREVLHQTEALLSQLLVTAPGLDEDTREVQRRHSQMVQACQSELDGAVDEFQNLMHTMDTRPA